jgi:hypothetical protein
MTDRVADYIPLRDWIADSGGAAFRTFSSCEWFIRRHRKELVQSGQFIIRKGSAGSLVGPRFGALVLEIMRRESREAVAA